MATMDVFNTDAFNTIQMTAALNKQEYLPTLLGDMNIFTSKPVRTKTIAIESRSETLALVQTSPRGAPLDQQAAVKRTFLNQDNIRIAKGDRLMADEIQGIRAFGSETELMQVQEEVARRQMRLRRDIELTWENMRLGAVQGVVADADSSTLFNWYTEFGVTQPTEIDFALGTAATNVRGKCAEVVRAMQRAAKGSWTTATRVIGLASDAFWDALISHALVRDTFLNHSAAAELRTDSAYQQFNFGGITFVNYRGTDDNSTVAIATDKCKFFPVGAPGVFEVAYSPAESFDWVNTPGQPFYALNVSDLDRNMYVDVEVYSYPLFYCTRPLMLQRAKRA